MLFHLIQANSLYVLGIIPTQKFVGPGESLTLFSRLHLAHIVDTLDILPVCLNRRDFNSNINGGVERFFAESVFTKFG